MLLLVILLRLTLIAIVVVDDLLTRLVLDALDVLPPVVVVIEQGVADQIPRETAGKAAGKTTRQPAAHATESAQDASMLLRLTLRIALLVPLWRILVIALLRRILRILALWLAIGGLIALLRVVGRTLIGRLLPLSLLLVGGALWPIALLLVPLLALIGRLLRIALLLVIVGVRRYRAMRLRPLLVALLRVDRLTRVILLWLLLPLLVRLLTELLLVELLLLVAV